MSDTPTAANAPDDLPRFSAIEHVPVTILDYAVLAVRRDDGTIFLAIRDLCAALQLTLSSQTRRLRNNPVLRDGLGRCEIATAGGRQEQLVLELELVPTWLLTVNTRRVSEDARENLRHFQRYTIREVYAAFGRLTGLPETSRQIEDLDELRRVDAALAALAERQSTMEDSQERARETWREMTDEIRAIATRVAALEQARDTTITNEQRGYIYQLVQAWGKAIAAADERISIGAAMRSCWASVKRRYSLASYHDLPASRYADCVAFIRSSYRSVTGEDLTIPEQQSLDLE
jgi:hypothetical protein